MIQRKTRGKEGTKVGLQGYKPWLTNNKWSWELGKRSRGDWHVLGRKGREGKTRTSNSRKLGWKKMNAHCLHLGTMWSNWTVWVSFCFCRFFLEDHQPIRCPYRIPILDPGTFLSLLQTWVHRLLRRNTTSWPQFNSLQWNRCHWHLTRKTGDWRLATGTTGSYHRHCVGFHARHYALLAWRTSPLTRPQFVSPYHNLITWQPLGMCRERGRLSVFLTYHDTKRQFLFLQCFRLFP